MPASCAIGRGCENRNTSRPRTPNSCPLILAAPVAFIAGVAQAARLGILIKGGKPFEALARTHTVMFDKTGTLTVGGARLVAIETAPGESTEEVLRIAGSLEQASHHVVAAAVVQAALGKGLDLRVPSQVRETMGSGLEGVIDGRVIRVGSHQLVYGSRKPEEWAVRALRRAAWRSCGVGPDERSDASSWQAAMNA